MELRVAQPTDAGALSGILEQAIDDHAWMPRLYSRAENIAFIGRQIDLNRVHVAHFDVSVGFIGMDGNDINLLYVHRDWRGQGVGTALLQGAQSQNVQLDLWCFQANTSARKFYERHGFAEVRRTDGENEENLPDILYRWTKGGAA